VSDSFYTLPPLSAGVQALLRGYSHVIPVHVAWSEQDAFGHVNNARYITYAESARIHWLAQLGAVTLTESVQTAKGDLSAAEATAALPRAAGNFLSGRAGAGPILKSVFFDYKSAATYPDVIVVGSRLTAVSGGSNASAPPDRFHLTHRLVSVKTGQLVGECEGVIVCVDYLKGGKKAPLPPLILAALRQQQREQAERDASEGGLVKPPRSSVNFEAH